MTNATPLSVSASNASIHPLIAGMLDAGASGIVDVLELFAGFESVDVAETVAVFESVVLVIVGGAFIVSAIGGAAPTASVGLEHVTTLATFPHAQPVPEALTNVAPAGSVSLTDTFVAMPGPALETERV